MEKSDVDFLPQAPPAYVVQSYGNGQSAPNAMIIAVPHGAMPTQYMADGTAYANPGYVVQSALPGYDGQGAVPYGQGAAPYGQGAAPYGQGAATYGQGQMQATIVVAQGNCPQCRTGYLVERYSMCGIICAICFFPLGLICCLLMKETKCGACGFQKSA